VPPHAGHSHDAHDLAPPTTPSLPNASSSLAQTFSEEGLAVEPLADNALQLVLVELRGHVAQGRPMDRRFEANKDDLLQPHHVYDTFVSTVRFEAAGTGRFATLSSHRIRLEEEATGTEVKALVLPVAAGREVPGSIHANTFLPMGFLHVHRLKNETVYTMTFEPAEEKFVGAFVAPHQMTVHEHAPHRR